MRRLFATRLTVSVWPFVLVAPGEWLFTTAYHQGQFPGQPFAASALGTLLLVVLSVLLAGLVVAAVNRLARAGHWPGTQWGAIAAYALATLVSSCAIIATGPILAGRIEAPWAFLFFLPLSRIPTIVVLALVCDQVVDSRRTYRELTGRVSARLLQARRMNALLESAQQQVAEDSGRLLRREVQAPLQAIVDRAGDQSDADVAHELDRFIDVRLRPLAHRTHPVSVRLGLIPALRSLDPGILIDVSPAIERLDADGELVSEDVRLQLYRWVRQCVEHGRATRVAFALRTRSLEVSAHPVRLQPLLDPVQIVAGLRSAGRGVVVAPLRGQTPPMEELLDTVRVDARPVRRRLSWTDVLTVPLPGLVGIVSLLSLSSFIIQLFLFSWPLTAGALLTSCAWAIAPIAAALLLSLFPAPPRSLGGLWWAVSIWVLIAVSAAAAFRVSTAVFDVSPSLTDAWGLSLFRAIYRFTLPGLALVAAHGVQVTLHRMLARANDAWRTETERQADILAESRELDRDVAEALHRNVQGRLSAAVVMIRLGQRDEAWPQVVDMAEHEVPGLLSRLDEVSGREEELLPRPPEGLAVREIVRAPAIPEAVMSDLRRAVSEIAVNAVRHGHATHLTVQVDDDGGVLQVRCSDDGLGLSPAFSPGLGSRLLDEISERWQGSWAVASSASGCVVEMELRTVPASRSVEAATR